MITRIIRYTLTLLLIYGAVTETGVWTGLSLLLIFVSIERASEIVKKNKLI